MALELLTKDEAATKPAGRGREEPNQNPTLEEPKYDRLLATRSLDTISFLYILVAQNINTCANYTIAL